MRQTLPTARSVDSTATQRPLSFARLTRPWVPRDVREVLLGQREGHVEGLLEVRQRRDGVSELLGQRCERGGGTAVHGPRSDGQRHRALRRRRYDVLQGDHRRDDDRDLVCRGEGVGGGIIQTRDYPVQRCCVGGGCPLDQQQQHSHVDMTGESAKDTEPATIPPKAGMFESAV